MYIMRKKTFFQLYELDPTKSSIEKSVNSDFHDTAVGCPGPCVFIHRCSNLSFSPRRGFSLNICIISPKPWESINVSWSRFENFSIRHLGNVLKYFQHRKPADYECLKVSHIGRGPVLGSNSVEIEQWSPSLYSSLWNAVVVSCTILCNQ